MMHVAVNTCRRVIVVTDFSTGRDSLHVNGERYTGSHGPDGVVPRMPILWSSDTLTALILGKSL